MTQLHVFCAVFDTVTTCSHLTVYFRRNNGRLFDLVPTTFVMNESRGDLEQSEGWQALAERHKLLKQRRFVQETLPSKQCLFNSWVVKDRSDTASVKVCV